MGEREGERESEKERWRERELTGLLSVRGLSPCIYKSVCT